MSLSYYNLFVGTDNGLLKGVNSKTKSFNNLNNMENLTKDREIVCMSWVNDIKQDQIYFFTRENHLVKYNTYHDVDAPFTDMGEVESGLGVVKGFETIDQNKILTCTDKGIFKFWSMQTESDESLVKNLLCEVKLGADIECIKKNKFNSNIIATGGKENDLKVWNLNDIKNSSLEACYKAKNVADNWMQLREPVWVMSLDFLDEHRVAVGTGHHQIRIYDLKSGVRRPCFNLKYDQYPISAMTALPDGNRLIVGNTRGEMEMIDLRSATSKNDQCRTVKKYKSFQGTIKSIQLVNTPICSVNGSNLCVATCGLDRYLRVHHVETSQLISKVYLKSRLNCLLFSKYEPLKAPKSSENNGKSLEDDQLSNVHSEDLGTDDIWSDMEQIVDEHPNILSKKSKKKLEKRMQDFESDSNDQDQQDDEGFKLPKALKPIKKSKKLK